MSSECASTSIAYHIRLFSRIHKSKQRKVKCSCYSCFTFTNIDGKVPRLDPIIKEYERNKNEELEKTKELSTPNDTKKLSQDSEKKSSNLTGIFLELVRFAFC